MALKSLIVLAAVAAVALLDRRAGPQAVFASEVEATTGSAEGVVADKGNGGAIDEEQLAKGREKFEFQAEVSRLMDIIINSLYSKKDVFLREVISNAADALDKLRFLSLSDDKVLASQPNLEIRVAGDANANTLTIRDTGLGMTKSDLINNLGTVARSGTAAFMEQLTNGGDLNLIGQFGVGFYSVYLVADKVRVVTKNNDDKQYVWESSADGSYTVAEDPRGDTLGRGTEITLFLKEDALEYAKEGTLRDLIKRYSEFITFPIQLRTSKMEEVEVPITEEEEEATKEDKPEGEDEDVTAEEETKEDKPKTRKEKQEKIEWENVNNQKAIWGRATTDVTDDEYRGFYKAISKEYTDPHTWIHFRGEGEVEFKSILYIPGQAPSDLYDNYYGKKSSLRLYVRKVLISDEFEELIPRYLNFIKGVVDSDDLPLNVSREQLQQTKILKVMAKKLVRKVLEMLRKLASTEKKALEDKAKEAKEGEDKEKDKSEDAAAVKEESGDEEGEAKGKKEFEIPSHLKEGADKAYTKFWEQFGKNIKLGVIEDSSNRSKLAKLLRFKSTATGKDGWRSLDDYVAAMKAGQKQIYFIAGESIEAVAESPFLERLQSKGLEVLYMTDPIDEYTIQNLPEYENHKLQAITKEGLVLPEEDKDTKRRDDVYKTDYKPLSEFLKTTYGDKVEKVTVSNRLSGTPCVLVTSQYGYSANMERIMRAQAFSDPSKGGFMASKKTLEINPRHPIIAELKVRAAKEGAADDEDTKDIARLLYDTALLNSGFPMDDPKEFAARMYRLMKNGLELENLDLLPEVDLPAEPEPEAEEEDVAEVEEDASAAGEEEL